jgi:uncharacterized protein with HEPN domain
VTVPAYSEREEDWLIDIVREAEAAIGWVGDLSFDAFVDDEILVAAVERKVANVTEACLRIERAKAEAGRFEELFPNETIGTIRGMGNRLRHDYRGTSLKIVYDTATANLPRLVERARELLGT